MPIEVKICIIVILLMIGIGIKIYFDRKKDHLLLLNYLERCWGEPSQREYSDKQWEAIRFYHEQEKQETDIDSITWNDLEMDEVFIQCNHTLTSVGEECLYRLLRQPSYDPDQLLIFEEQLSFLQEHPDKLEELRIALAQIGKLKEFSVYQQLLRTKDLPPARLWREVLLGGAMAVSALLCFVKPDIMVLVTILLVGVNVVSYYQRKAQIDQYFRLFSFLVGLVLQCDSLSVLCIPGLEKEREQFQVHGKKLQGFVKNSWLLSGGSGGNGSFIDGFMDYIRMLFHVDLIKFGSMVLELQKHRESLFILYQLIGYYDCLTSVLSYRAMLGEDYVVPQIVQDKENILEFEQMKHPLLSQGVPNSMQTGSCILVTGSNASGKSTFLKSVAINTILAQTLHTAVAKSFRTTGFMVMTSMALRDDLRQKESYFIVEINSLKRILDQSKEGTIPILCCIDEVLRGTNTVERIAASAEILRGISAQNILCFAATHDIELTYLLEDEYDNYHFQEQIRSDQVVFDYTIYEGRATSRNAIKLLQMLGYDESLVDRAEQNVAAFLETGTWK